MVAAALALVSLFAVPAPPAPGQWHQLGAAAVSRPSKPLHFFRTATYPSNLAVVVTSTSSQPIRVVWWTYCEFESDDGETEQNQQTVSGVRSVVAYPSVLSGASRCYVSVNVGARRGARLAAAVFSG